MQRNWIGRSEGLLVRFAIDPASAPEIAREAGAQELEIYSTRPDTLFGAKFMALAPDHPLAAAAAGYDPKLQAFIEDCKRVGTSLAVIETAEKKGYDTGLRVVIRSTRHGVCQSMSPISSLMDYGTRRDLRLPRARPARSRFRQRLWPGNDAGRLPARRRIPLLSSSTSKPMTATES